jgi:hypothetical protein
MDEVWGRAGLILGALAVAALVSYAQRRRSRRPYRSVETPDLGAGIYLFSSATCSTCETARNRLEERVGSGRYRELVWEEDAELFGSLGVDAVPTVLVVEAGGRGRLYVGGVEAALASVDP